jgi:hypothetical protein
MVPEEKQKIKKSKISVEGEKMKRQYLNDVFN